MSARTTERMPKSKKLSIDQWKALNKFVDQQNTVLDAAIFFGITRQSLDRIQIVKQGSPANIDKIIAGLQRVSMGATIRKEEPALK